MEQEQRVDMSKYREQALDNLTAGLLVARELSNIGKPIVDFTIEMLERAMYRRMLKISQLLK